MANQADGDSARESATDHGYDAFLSDIKVGKPKRISVKHFLKLWNYQRRGAYIVRQIENELNKRGLACTPEIAKADYYGSVNILDKRDLAPGSSNEAGWPISSVIDDERELVGVGLDTPLCEVETMMVMRDFSQLPVLSKTRRELYGTVSWKTLARWPHSRKDSTAKEAMVKGDHVAPSSDDLLQHIGAIIANDYIYIRSPDNVFVAILTATDLADNFLKTAGSFIRIGEIEQRLRALVNRLPLPTLQEAKLPGDNREILGASDLTFGQYVAILEKPENWDKIGLDFDRATVVKNLVSINQIRNDVMHFRPRPLEPEMEDLIQQGLNWLRQARPVRD
ncbi:CBS domain-containing protein [Mycobacterium celatum]|uniref:CBS domain-containing protein n=1 Tax=Mycobacterium celatum TaxID=28045 RepID=UPI000A680A89|nr:CBS domain-containing protein [Mycobacterium celatum]